MQIKERILLLLNDGPKRIEEINKEIDKNPRVLSATISNYPKIFLRLNRGFVGLYNRDEHLTKKWKNDLPIYKRIANILVCGPMRIENIYKELSDVKKVSIRASITYHPELFFRIKQGLIGRTGRDEYLINRYNSELSIRQDRKKKREDLVKILEEILKDGSKSYEEIRKLLPYVNVNLLRWVLREKFNYEF